MYIQIQVSVLVLSIIYTITCVCFSKEISALKSELDALCEQYTHKCLENVHLAEALCAERDALQRYQSQNLALSAHNQVREHTY